MLMVFLLLMQFILTSQSLNTGLAKVDSGAHRIVPCDESARPDIHRFACWRVMLRLLATSQGVATVSWPHYVERHQTHKAFTYKNLTLHLDHGLSWP